MKPIFVPEDFIADDAMFIASEYAADLANEKINKLIESWPVVYRDRFMKPFPSHNWCETKTLHSVQKASLAFIEEIPKEPCKHEPVRDTGYPRQWDKHWSCNHCGVELIAEWREKK